MKEALSGNRRVKGNRTKLIFFKLVAILLPIIVILFVELLLKCFGYGHDLSLFVSDKDSSDYWVMNHYVSERYFNDPLNATIGNAEPFKKEKQKDTRRIFVLGESTTLGYPYMHNGSFHRWLQYRLLQMYPEIQFEVINLSLTAVNSFAVNDMAKEITNYNPDAVLIYSGHNEYYGALGVVSTNGLGNSLFFKRAQISLSYLRFVQLLFNTYHSFSKKQTDTAQNLMERMAAHQSIEYLSKDYNAGITQFRENMFAACQTLSNHHIPVFISNLISNEKDLKPFDGGQIEDTNSANYSYQQGLEKYQKGDYATAKSWFISARQKDKLRFRAPEEINAAIQEITKQLPGVFLVDTKGIFESVSPHHILDSTTLLEHVHPNLTGYALLSEAFFQAINKQNILPKEANRNLSVSELQNEMPVTTVDSLFGTYSILLLKHRWPFNDSNSILSPPVSTEEKIAYDMLKKNLPWNEAMDQLMNYYKQKHDTSGMLKVAEAVMLEYPLEPTFYVTAAHLSEEVNMLGKAENYLQRAFIMQPSMALAKDIFIFEMKCDKPQKAISYIDFGLEKYPGDEQLTNVKNSLTQLMQIKEKNIAYKGMYAKQLSDLYIHLGFPEVARKYQDVTVASSQP